MDTEKQNEIAGALRHIGFLEATCKASGSAREFIPASHSLAIGSIEVTPEAVAFLLPHGIHDREKAIFVSNVPEVLVDEILRLMPSLGAA